MSAQSYPSLLSLSLAVPERPPAARLVALSFTLHLCLLALMLSVPISATSEPSLDSYHVALVSMPILVETIQPRPKLPIEAPNPPPIEQAPQEPKALPPALKSPSLPAARPERPAPVVQRIAPIPAVEVPKRKTVPQPDVSVAAGPTLPTLPKVQAVEVPTRRRIPQRSEPVAGRPHAPSAAPLPVVPPLRETYEAKQRFTNQLREAFHGIERPPEVPELGRPKPTMPTAPLRRSSAQKLQVGKVLDKLPEVPALPSVSDTTAPRKQGSQPRRRVATKLAERLQDIGKPKPEQQSSLEVALASKAALLERPLTAIQVPGADSTLQRYLALVQSKIRALWVAPPVDVTGRSFQVVIRFRLHRNGSISNVVVEETSGNGYYDDAGKRAVQAADPLPEFPGSMSESTLDAHFSFTVAGQAG
ncbi:MAG: TonB family protein [Nitrospirae bacterium]|nr:TonB family protein [Nitrospirota bacterium]